jgi:uncharacterized protein YggE
MTKLLVRLLFVSTLVACSERTPQVIAVPQLQGAAPPPAVMTVTGSATLDVAPDCADLTMTIMVERGRPGLAATTLAKKQDDVVATLTRLGLATADIKISLIALNPIYDGWWPHIHAATYRAEVTITATTKKFELVPDMMEAGAKAGASSIRSEFRRSDLPELKKKVRDMALRAAKAKAEQTASTLGTGLGRVTSVAEAPVGQMWSSPYFPRAITTTVVNVQEIQAAPPTGAATTIGGTLQPLTLEVTIGFELANKA